MLTSLQDLDYADAEEGLWGKGGPFTGVSCSIASLYPYWLTAVGCAGSLSDHVQPQGLPPAAVQAQPLLAADVLPGLLVLHCRWHQHPLLHCPADYHYLDWRLPHCHQQGAGLGNDYLWRGQLPPALLRAII